MVEAGRVVFRIDWRRGPREMRQAIDRARLDALKEMEMEVRKNAPTQGLKDAVRRTAAQVVVEHPAAAVVEFGARPHWPPPGALIPWLLSVGKSPDEEFPVARAIAGKGHGKRPQGGFEERPYFRPAMETVRARMPAIFRRIWER